MAFCEMPVIPAQAGIHELGSGYAGVGKLHDLGVSVAVHVERGPPPCRPLATLGRERVLAGFGPGVGAGRMRWDRWAPRLTSAAPLRESDSIPDATLSGEHAGMRALRSWLEFNRTFGVSPRVAARVLGLRGRSPSEALRRGDRP